MSEVECGLACLTMVLNHYGSGISLSELRTRSGVGRDGLSALDLVKLARQLGMRTRAISVQRADLRLVKLPAIVHWQFDHFLVVERWARRHVDVVDPALGRRRLTHREFDEGFTGVALLLEPGVDFQRRPSASAHASHAYVLQYLKRAPGLLLLILGASALLLLLGLALPLLSKIVIDEILPNRMTELMPVLAVGLVVLFASTIMTALLREWLLVRLRGRIDIAMMLGFVERLLVLPYAFFQQRSTGDLLARAASNAMLREILNNQLLSAVMDTCLVVFYLALMISQSPPLGLLTLLLGVLQVLLLVVSSRAVSRLALRELTAFGKSQGYLAEAITGISTLKASGAEHLAFGRWSNLFFSHLNIALRYNVVTGTMTGIFAALASLGPLLLLWVGATQVLNGSITLGTMVALLALAGAFFAPLASLVTSGQQFQLLGANLSRISDVTEAEPEQFGQQTEPAPRLTGRVHVRNVSYRYAENAPEVLRDVDIRIEAGSRVAIVGPSGSGKSTLGKLLLALYQPTSGEILYDGRPLQRLNWQEVRRQFGVVLQDSAVFSGSVRSNITLTEPGMDEDRVVEAARVAAIHDDILAMPMGYDTSVSEGGSALSGGQQQRLALARAVAHEPTILLLDEATSHLDVETEARVALNLRALACTQIIIAHRLSTVRDADRILVLREGSVVESGTHDELVLRGGAYAQLIRQQLEPQRDGTEPPAVTSGAADARAGDAVSGLWESETGSARDH